MDWFYRFWVVPIAGLTWFGIAIALCFVFLPLGILALIGAVVLWGELLSHRPTKQSGTGDEQEPTQ